MAKMMPADLIKPVPPGISWTDPAKGRPWTQPPKMVDVADVAQYYVDKMSSDVALSNALDALETNVPIASLAEALMLASVLKGEHTIDAGILVMPVIIEMLKTTAEIHGTKNYVFPDDVTDDDLKMPKRVVKKAIESMNNKTEQKAIEPNIEIAGLMSRKNKEEVV